jgi:hypothetical protein
MPGSRRVGRFSVLPMDGKIRISTSNHEPVDGIRGHESTDFTPEFPQRCHKFNPIYQFWSCSLRDWGLSQTWCQNREFANLFLLHGTTQVDGVIHHPDLGNDFTDQLSMTEKSHDRTL